MLTTHYSSKICAYPGILGLFKLRGNSAADYARIERNFTSSSLLAEIDNFKKNFLVKDEHKEALETMVLCLNYFQRLKSVVIFASERQLENPNRRKNLLSLINFFKRYTIDKDSSRNELFLIETLEELLDLPLDVLVMQASIAPVYALANVLKIVNIRDREDLNSFLKFAHGHILTDLNHPYIYIKYLNVTASCLSTSS